MPWKIVESKMVNCRIQGDLLAKDRGKDQPAPEGQLESVVISTLQSLE
jgi:hypothetical protein